MHIACLQPELDKLVSMEKSIAEAVEAFLCWEEGLDLVLLVIDSPLIELKTCSSSPTAEHVLISLTAWSTKLQLCLQHALLADLAPLLE